MIYVIEFYRLRDEDDAHARLGRVPLDLPNLRAALRAAGSLLHTLSMPQVPDGLRNCDEDGGELYAGPATVPAP